MNTIGILAHIGSFLAAWAAVGLICPLLVLLIKGDSSPFVRRHSVESLNFQITTFGVVAIGLIVGLVTFGVGFFVVIPALIVWGIYYLIAVIMGGVAAHGGRDYRYPVTVRLVK